MEHQGNDWVYDVEFFMNFFCVGFRSFPDGERRILFEISERKDEREELLAFLQTPGMRLIGFNNNAYDYPVLHYLIERPNEKLHVWWSDIQRQLFADERQDIYQKDRKVFQIDLYKINHYDNQARSTSLKWLEFTRRWYKVQDLPVDPSKKVDPSIYNQLIDYNWNDIDFTFVFAEECMEAIQFREDMSKKLKKNVMDMSDVALGEYLNRVNYLKRTKYKWQDIKNERTYRTRFDLSDVIPSVVSFYDPVMKKFLSDLKQTSMTDAGEFTFDIVFSNLTGFDRVVSGGIPETGKQLLKEQMALNTIVRFAKGGIHTCDLPRIVDRKEGWVLMEKDVASMYPRSIVVDKIYPAHLGIEWNESINDAYNYRLDVLKPKLNELKKTVGKNHPEYRAVDSEQMAYKLAMNGGGFGKLGSSYSWQYDPLAKYRVTIGCELKLLMLIEAFVLRGIEVVSANTDGVVIHYPKEKQEVVDRIHKWWEEKTQFVLEDTFYNKIVFSSVNDYIAVIVDGQTDQVLYNKFKGDFEIDPDPHKNNSQRIVPIALMEYFINGKKLSDVVGKLGYEFVNSKGKKEQVTIYDYCLGRKSTKSCVYHVVSGGKTEIIPDKVIRYFISTGRKTLLKQYTRGKMTGRFQKVNAGWNIEPFMQYQPPTAFNRSKDGTGDYGISKTYYLNECMKVIEKIERGTRYLNQGYVIQGTLF